MGFTYVQGVHFRHDYEKCYVSVTIFIFFASRVISVLFGLDLVIRCLSLGFFKHENAYFMDPWNRMDFAW